MVKRPPFSKLFMIHVHGDTIVVNEANQPWGFLYRLYTFGIFTSMNHFGFIIGLTQNICR